MTNKFDNSEFEKKILMTHKNFLVFVRADWCSNCKEMESYIQLAAIELGEESIFEINADENHAYLKRYKVFGVPTTLLFNHGKLIERKTGILNNRQLISLFKTSENYNADDAAKNELKGFFRWPL